MAALYDFLNLLQGTGNQPLAMLNKFGFGGEVPGSTIAAPASSAIQEAASATTAPQQTAAPPLAPQAPIPTSAAPLQAAVATIAPQAAQAGQQDNIQQAAQQGIAPSAAPAATPVSPLQAAAQQAGLTIKPPSTNLEDYMPAGVNAAKNWLYNGEGANTRLAQEKMAKAQEDYLQNIARTLQIKQAIQTSGMPQTQGLPEGYQWAKDKEGNYVAQRIEGVNKVLNTKETIEGEGGLRKEFDAVTKDFREQIRPAYERIKAAGAKPSAAGDLALIFNFMKMLDPGSTVREGEFATAQNAAGIPEIVRNMFNRMQNGERLNPDQRADFLGQSEGLYKSAVDQYDQQRGRYRGLASGYSFNPQNIVPDFNVLPTGGAPAQQPGINPYSAEKARRAQMNKGTQ